VIYASHKSVRTACVPSVWEILLLAGLLLLAHHLNPSRPSTQLLLCSAEGINSRAQKEHPTCSLNCYRYYEIALSL